MSKMLVDDLSGSQSSQSCTCVESHPDGSIESVKIYASASKSYGELTAILSMLNLDLIDQSKTFCEFFSKPK